MKNVLIQVGENVHLESVLHRMLESEEYNVVAAVSVPAGQVREQAVKKGVRLLDNIDARLIGALEGKECDALSADGDELLFMLSRFINAGNLSGFKKTEFIKKTVGYWKNWLESNKVDILVFQCVPHELYDYILYRLGQELNRKVLFIEKTFWPNRLIVGGDYRQVAYGDLQCQSETRFDKEEISRELERVKADLPPYWTTRKLKGYKKNVFSHIVSVMLQKRFKLSYPGFYGGRYYQPLELMQKGWLWHLFWRTWISIRKVRLVMEYHMVLQKDDDFPKKPYLLFFLQVQPEKSTSPLGGEYCDQIHAIKSIRSWLPDEFELVVREHPSQFRRFQSLHKGRGLGFYKAIRQAGGVILDYNISKIKLMENAVGVITVAGSVALESYMKGKHAAYMGYPWYSGIEGIKSIRSRKDMEFFLYDIENPIKNDEVENELFSFVNTSFAGVFEPFNAELYPDHIDDWSSQLFDCIHDYVS